MRIFTKLALFTSLLAGVATSASAQVMEPCCAEAEWATTFSTSVSDRYVFPKSGFVAYDGPVLQSDLAFTKGEWTFDIWNSLALSEPGSYGNRGGGDEIDFTATWNGSYEGFSLSASGSYWLLDHFGAMNDDMVQLYGRIGRPFAFDWLTVTPYAQYTQWLGVGFIAPTSFIDVGATVDFALSDDWKIGVDASYSTDVTNSIPIANVGITATYQLSPSWSLYGSFKAAERMKPGVTFGLTVNL